MLSNTSAIVALHPSNIPRKSCNILTAWFVKGELTAERLQNLFTDSKIPKERAFQNLRRVWTTFLGYTFWRTVPNFKISNHIRQYDYGGRFNLTKPSNAEDIKEIVCKLEGVEWREHQSPWEFLLINGLVDSKDGSTQTCFILRFNHVLGDGYSIYNFIDALFDKKTLFPGKSSETLNVSVVSKLRTVFMTPYYSVGCFVPLIFGRKIYNGKLSRDGRCSFTRPIPVVDIKKIAKFHKVSSTTVAHCVVQRVIGKALREAKMFIPEKLSIRSPVPVFTAPNHPGGFVNHFTLATAELPTLIDPVSTHLKQIERSLIDIKSPTASLLFQYITSIISLFPIAIRRVICEGMAEFGLSYAISTFPCSTHPEYVDGLEVTQVLSIIGLPGSPGMDVLTTGTNRELVFSFCVDKKIFQSDETTRKLGMLVEDEIKELLNDVH
ncbi:unnamed protein product [Allacma fusca]|uniref:Diacylglycerol O-acyltransferase n=1 Tax=Allacma fusca TaxID=39272 RepID=A0A8J2JKJ3_9HEXA|nr:unnamed protein product [Allacma fusca]